MPQFWEKDALVQPAKDPWAQFEEISPALSRGAPRPILTVPDTDKQQDNARADKQLGLSQTQTSLAVQNNSQQQDQQRFQREQGLRGDYEQIPEVKAYRSVVPLMMQAIQLPDDPTADNTLLYRYAKVMDPGSVVRESEQGAAANGAGYWDAAVAFWKKQLGIEGGGLSPEVRKNLKRDMVQAVQQMRMIYQQQRGRFADDAKANGIEPARVIGPDAFEPFRPQFEAWQKKQQQQAPGGAAGLHDPEMVGGLPKGTDIQWSVDKPEEPFDHNRWLWETYRMTPEHETQVAAMWNQNSGNPRLTVDAVKAWYRDKGIPIPDDGSLADGVARARAGQQFGGFDDSAAREAYTKQLRANLQKEGFDPTSGGAYAARALRGAEFGLTDEIQGLGGAVDALFNNRGVADGYRFERDRSRQAFSDMEAQQGALGTAAELGGGLVGGGLGASRAPITAARAATEGAAAGALAGFGYGEGAQDSLVSAAGGAAVGGGAGYAIGRGAEALAARRAGRGPSEAAQAYAEGQRYGLDLSIGDVGGRSSKMVERSLDAQPASASILNAPRNRLQGQIDTAVDNVAGTFGPETSFRGMGEAAQKGANKWMDRFNEVVGKAYDVVSIPPKVQARLDNTRATLAKLTDVFESNPDMRRLMQNGRFSSFLRALTPDDVAEEGVRELTDATNRLSSARKQLRLARDTGGLQSDIGAAQRQVSAAEQAVEVATQKAYSPPQGGELSWEDLKHFRSIIGEQMGEALLTDGSPKSQLRALYGALSKDMEATASAQGPKAMAQFKRANDLFAQGQQRIEGAISSLIGNDTKGSPEKAAAFLQRIARDGRGSTDLNALAEVRKTLRPEEWSQVSNAFVRLIGQPTNSAGRDFNPATFIRAYDDMAAAAKNLLFGGANKELRQNLDAFSSVIRRVTKNDSTRNTSGSAFGLGSAITGGAGATTGAAIGASIGGPVGAILGVLVGKGAANATTAGTAKLWTNPAFVRWATGYSKMLAAAARGELNEAANARYLSALSRLAANDNVIASDALGLRHSLEAVLARPAQQSAATPAPGSARSEGTEQTGPQ